MNPQAYECEEHRLVSWPRSRLQRNMDHAVVPATTSPFVIWVPEQVHLRCFVNYAVVSPTSGSGHLGLGVPGAQDIDIIAISRLFWLPIGAAAVRLQRSQSLLQRSCREHGVSRWPFRRMTRLDKVSGCIRALQRDPGLRCAQTAMMAASFAVEVERARLVFRQLSKDS